MMKILELLGLLLGISYLLNRNIVDYLEGGIESFKHKVKIYKSII